MHRLLFTLYAIVLPVATVVAGSDYSLQLVSGTKQVALLELYTSEGCSSCPPADRWLSSLKSDPRLWLDFVPVALHVDYWDYIGWDDRYAQRRFSNRQRNYVRAGAARVSYTPGFFSRGEEWLGWRSGETPHSNDDNVGTLRLNLSGQTVTAHFEPVADIGGVLVLNVAILGMQRETAVRAGENKGRTLAHDFVALHWQSVSMHAAENGYVVTTDLESLSAKNENLAIAAWVSTKGEQTPLQAVGGYLGNL